MDSNTPIITNFMKFCLINRNKSRNEGKSLTLWTWKEGAGTGRTQSKYPLTELDAGWLLEMYCLLYFMSEPGVTNYLASGAATSQPES